MLRFALGVNPEQGEAEPSVRGAVVREMMIWYVAQFGRVSAERVFAAIPQAARARYLKRAEPAFGIVSNAWYPMSLLRPMLDAVSAGLPDEGRDLAREANASVVPRVIRGFYKVLFDLAATPETYARHVPRLWRRLHTTGARSMRIRSPGDALSAIDDWPGHHPLLCWMVIYTMVYAFEAMGFKKCEVERVSCVDHGGSRCETVLRYGRT
jgi:hypothetical protein